MGSLTVHIICLWKKMYLPHGKFCPLETEYKVCGGLVVLTSQEMTYAAGSDITSLFL